MQLKEFHSIQEILSLYEGTLNLFKSKGFNTYVLECDVKSSNELLEISNTLYEKSGIVNWSEPEFYVVSKLRLTRYTITNIILKTLASMVV